MYVFCETLCILNDLTVSVLPQGAAVLRMLSDFLSEPVFVEGLSVC